MRKVLEKSRKFANDNKQSQSKAIAERVLKVLKKVFLLQNNVIVPCKAIREATTNPKLYTHHRVTAVQAAWLAEYQWRSIQFLCAA